MIYKEETGDLAIDLLAEAMAGALGDLNNLPAYRVCLKKYPLIPVRTAFREALHAPVGQIRKSRGAYFTYLVKKLTSQESQLTHPV